MRNNYKFFSFLPILLALLLVGAGCQYATNVNNDYSSNESMMEEGQVRELTIDAGEFFFTPKDVILNAGEKVKLTLKNVGKGNHDWRIEGTDIKTKIITSGQTDIVEFTAPSAGTYALYCSVPGHRQMGMVGELIVK